MQLLDQIGLICLSPECGYVCMYARIHVIMSYASHSKCTPCHHVRLSHFHAFIHPHCRISFRYARYMRSTWCGTKPEDDVGGPSWRWKDWTRARIGDVGKTAQLTNLTRCQILGKPQSIISLPLLLNTIEYICYIYCCIKCRSWVKPLLHIYHSLCSKYTWNPM
jgi:hypothetical protein